MSTKGKTRFYADENIEEYLVQYIRHEGYRVDYAIELGYSGRDDSFHLQEAKHRKAVLLSRDLDFLNHKTFPFHILNDTAIVVIAREQKGAYDINFGFVLVNLFTHVTPSGNKNLYGLKIELRGSKAIFYARIKGKIRTDEFDIYRETPNRELFIETQ